MKLSEEADRFDLENAIMDCWRIVDDLEQIREHCEFDDREDNLMLGLKSLYDVKFNNLQQIFEGMVHTRKM